MNMGIFYKFLAIGILFVLALTVVNLRQENRQIFMQLKKLEKQHDSLYSTWTQYLVEQATLASHARVDNIARNDLHMHFPDKNQIMYAKQN